MGNLLGSEADVEEDVIYRYRPRPKVEQPQLLLPHQAFGSTRAGIPSGTVTQADWEERDADSSIPEQRTLTHSTPQRLLKDGGSHSNGNHRPDGLQLAQHIASP